MKVWMGDENYFSPNVLKILWKSHKIFISDEKQMKIRIHVCVCAYVYVRTDRIRAFICLHSKHQTMSKVKWERKHHPFSHQ